MERTVVTGVSLISAAGIGLEENERRLHEKRSGIQRITRFEMAPKVKTDIAGLVPAIPIECLPQDLLPRLNEEDLRQDYVKAAVYTTAAALAEAGVGERIAAAPRRTALFVASSLGNYLYVSELVKDYFMKHLYKITSLIHGMNSYLPSRLADLFGIKGPCLFVSSSCTSSLNAILQADALIKNGVIDRAVICAVDLCLETGTYHLWNKLRVLSHRNEEPGTACRPYCKTRDGLVVSEAAGCFVLEREGEARVPGYARLLGFGLSNGAHDFVKPTPCDLTQALVDALAGADVAPGSIDFIAGSASGSPHCDHFETEAIREVFGPEADRIPVFAYKSFLGSTFGTQAVSEGSLALQCLRTQRLPEVRNVFEHDERMRANVYYDVRQYDGYPVNRLLFINSGFAGNHMAIIYERM